MTILLICLVFFRNLKKGALEKGYVNKLPEIDFQICDNFAHPRSDARNETLANLCNAPLANAPFSVFLSFVGKGGTRPFVTCPFAKSRRNIVGTELWTERTVA